MKLPVSLVRKWKFVPTLVGEFTVPLRTHVALKSYDHKN